MPVIQGIAEPYDFSPITCPLCGEEDYDQTGLDRHLGGPNWCDKLVALRGKAEAFDFLEALVSFDESVDLYYSPRAGEFEIDGKVGKTLLAVVQAQPAAGGESDG